MKLDTKAFALAVGLISAAIFVLCAALVALWPAQMTALASWWAHIDLTGLARMVTFSSFVGGLILTFVSHYIVAWLFALLYNKFTK